MLLTLLAEMPEAWGVGVDISAEALNCARLNAERLGARVAAPRSFNAIGAKLFLGRSV